MGNIYIFNLNGVAIDQLQVNNQTVAGGIAAWSTVPASMYQPAQACVPRSSESPNNLTSAAFCQGVANSLHVHWAGGHQTVQTDVLINQNPNLMEDFLLYVAATQSILFDQFGSVVNVIQTLKKS